MAQKLISLLAVLGFVTGAIIVQAKNNPSAISTPVQPASEAGSAVVARVNGIALYSRDLQIEMDRLFPFYSVHGGKVPAQLEPQIRQTALDRLVLEELLFQEAKRRNLQIPPREVELRIQKARRGAPSSAAFDRTVTQNFGSIKEFRDRTRRTLMIESLWDSEVVRPSFITERGLRKFYDQNHPKFVRPESVWLQTISFQFPEQASAAERQPARAQAEEVLPKARAAKSFESFEALAEKYSTDDWRVMNGDHGWVHRGTLDRELEAAFQMKPNEVSGVIPGRNGYYILRANGHRAEELMPFSTVKNAIKKSLVEAKIRERGKQLEQRLKRQARIEIP